MKKAPLLVAALGAMLLVPLLVVVLMTAVLSSSDDQDGGGAQAGLKTGTVPPEFEPWIIKAGKVCAEISAPVIAAQIDVESGFNPKAVSPAGAQGLSQFMPYTWPSYGEDANHNGVVSPFDAPDAIMAQANFDCKTAAQAKQDIAAGKIHGDLLDIVLSAYNCGYGCILSNGGPNISNGETESYAPKIKRLIPKYSAIGAGSGGKNGPLAGPVNRRIIQAAMRWLGTTYAWAGGTKDGPSPGSAPDAGVIGFDCSGLTLYAIAQATNMKVLLPHFTGDHSNPGQLYDPQMAEVPFDQKQPGDEIYFGSGGNTHHVGIYYGKQNGQDMLLNAPQSGDVIKISPLSGWNGEEMYVRRVKAT